MTNRTPFLTQIAVQLRSMCQTSSELRKLQSMGSVCASYSMTREAELCDGHRRRTWKRASLRHLHLFVIESCKQGVPLQCDDRTRRCWSDSHIFKLRSCFCDGCVIVLNLVSSSIERKLMCEALKKRIEAPRLEEGFFGLMEIEPWKRYRIMRSYSSPQTVKKL